MKGRTLCALSEAVDLSARSAFKATYEEPRQLGGSGETQSHFLPATFLLAWFMPLSHPNLTIHSCRESNFRWLHDLSIQSLDSHHYTGFICLNLTFLVVLGAGRGRFVESNRLNIGHLVSSPASLVGVAEVPTLRSTLAASSPGPFLWGIPSTFRARLEGVVPWPPGEGVGAGWIAGG